jgi:hypothetical protein
MNCHIPQTNAGRVPIKVTLIKRKKGRGNYLARSVTDIATLV